MEIALGPPPDNVDVPLDTTITVDAVAPAALDDLRLSPDTPIGMVYSEATSALTYLTSAVASTAIGALVLERRKSEIGHGVKSS